MAEGTGVGNLSGAITNSHTTPFVRSQTLRIIGDGTWNATAANFWNGTAGNAATAQTSVNINSGTLQLSGAGTFGAPVVADVLAGRIDVNANGRLLLDESASDANRLNTRNLRLLGGGDLFYVGGAAADTSENIGQTAAFNVDRGQSIINIDASATNSATLSTGTVGAVNRSNLATIVVNGDNIGSAASAGVGVLVGGNAAGGFTYIGQTGATGTTNKSIVPWTLVENAALPGGVAFGTSDSAAAIGTTGTNVFRGLAASETLTAFSNIGSVGYVVGINPNVTLAASSVVDGPLLVNSLRLDGGADVTMSGPGRTLTLESGGMLVTGATSTFSNGFLTTSSNRDIIIHARADTEINAPIMGTSGGLVKTGAGFCHIHRSAGLGEGQFRLPFIESCEHITCFDHRTSLHTGLDDFSHRIRGHDGIALGRKLAGDTQKARKDVLLRLRGLATDHRGRFGGDDGFRRCCGRLLRIAGYQHERKRGEKTEKRKLHEVSRPSSVSPRMLLSQPPRAFYPKTEDADASWCGRRLR